VSNEQKRGKKHKKNKKQLRALLASWPIAEDRAKKARLTNNKKPRTLGRVFLVENSGFCKSKREGDRARLAKGKNSQRQKAAASRRLENLPLNPLMPVVTLQGILVIRLSDLI